MISRNLFASFICLIFLSCNGSNPTNEIKQVGDSAITTRQSPFQIDSLSQIPANYEAIVQLVETKSVDSTSFNYNCDGEKSGKLIYYFKDKNLILIEKSYSEYSHTEGVDQYFLNDGEPFFIYRKVTNWSFDSNLNMEGATVDKVSEHRFYIVKNDVVKCLLRKYDIHSAPKNQANTLPTKNVETTCPSLDILLTDYKVLVKHKNQEGSLDCL